MNTKLDATQISQTVLNLVAVSCYAAVKANAKLSEKAKRSWLNAACKAHDELIDNPRWSYADGTLLVLSRKSERVYCVSNEHKCQCEAAQHGMVCWHFAMLRLIERYIATRDFAEESEAPQIAPATTSAAAEREEIMAQAQEVIERNCKCHIDEAGDNHTCDWCQVRDEARAERVILNGQSEPVRHHYSSRKPTPTFLAAKWFCDEAAARINEQEKAKGSASNHEGLLVAPSLTMKAERYGTIEV